MNRHWTIWCAIWVSPFISTSSRALVTAPDAVSTFEVRQYDIAGNTLLSPAEVGAVFANAIGPSVSLNQVFKALAGLHRAYQNHGFTGVSVTIPQQDIEDGVVLVKVIEPASVKLTTTRGLPTNTTPALTLEVRQYEITGNTILPSDTVEALFTNAVGKNVTLEQIRKAAGDLQLAYRERGYVTVSVSVPPQQITNATVKVQVTEGRLVDVRVTGNRYFSSNNVMRALPSLREALNRQDQVINGQVLQREMDIANQNSDRQIYPVVNPGPEPGTSALELRIQDRLPLHGRLELNNQSTPGTPEWRINTTANYNNLWQADHSVGVFYGFSPEEFKTGDKVDDYFFNQPLIANFGAYYRIPIGGLESVQERINNSAGFGYNEATHQFLLPPPGTRPDLTFSVSGSSDDTGVKLGPRSVVTNTPLLSIVSQDSGQNITLNNSAGTSLNIPFGVTEARHFNFSAGFDWKQEEIESYNTNNFIITTVVTNEQGAQTIVTHVPSPQPTSKDNLSYARLGLGLGFFENDAHGSFSGNLDLSGNLGGSPQSVIGASYTPKAKPQFGKAMLTVSREQKLGKDWSLLLRANGQAATGPAINNDAYVLGGVNNVRGYLEADERGDDGWFGAVELHTPFISTRAATVSGFAPVWVRGSVFVDAGQRFLLEESPVAGFPETRFLWSTGFGLSANINRRLDVHIIVGVPMRDSANTTAGQPRVHFLMGGQF